MVLTKVEEYRGLSAKTLPESKEKQEGKSTKLYPTDKDFFHLHISNFSLNNDVKIFNVRLKRNELDPRWRFEGEIFNSASPWNIFGYDNTYEEDRASCSIQYEVWAGKMTNNGPQKDYRIASDRLSTNNERLIRYFGTSDQNKPFYVYRWDEDGFLCGQSQIYLNGNNPTDGFAWLFQ
jgi:hypothetical protein